MKTKFVFALVTIILMSSLVNMHALAALNYYGTVVDEDGKPLNLVEVAIYDDPGNTAGTSTGIYLKSVATDINGTFSVYLDWWKSYQFIFKKDGYVSDTLNYTGIDVQTVSMGEIKLVRNVSLQLNVATVVTAPGSRLTLGFQIKNSGKEDEIVALETTSGNWATMIKSENIEVKAVVLAAGSALNLNLIVDVPLDASSSIVSLIAQGRAVSTKTFNVKVEGQPPTLAVCTYPSKQAQPGGNVDFKVEVNNPTEQAALVNLSVNNMPDKWGITILNTE